MYDRVVLQEIDLIALLSEPEADVRLIQIVRNALVKPADFTKCGSAHRAVASHDATNGATPGRWAKWSLVMARLFGIFRRAAAVEFDVTTRVNDQRANCAAATPMIAGEVVPICVEPACPNRDHF